MNRRSEGPAASLAGALLIACVLGGCGDEPAAPPAPPASRVDLAEARVQVREVFAAIERRDCDALVDRLHGLRDRAHCEESVEELNEHGLRLVEIIETHADGRDPDAAVVRVGVMRSGRTRQTLVRATHRDGRWTVAL